MSGRALVVEDDARVARSWVRLLSLEGWDVESVVTLDAAREAIDGDEEFDVVLLDVRLPDGRGLALLPELNQRRPSPKIVVITGEADAALSVELVGQVDAVIPKPLTSQDLRDLIAKIGRDASAPQLEDFAGYFGLSPNEARVLELAAGGADKLEIATALGCKPTAVATYWKRISKKTECRGQRDIFAKLWRHSQSVR